jgi:hypothetical protein
MLRVVYYRFGKEGQNHYIHWFALVNNFNQETIMSINAHASTAAPMYPNQVGFSLFGTISAMITALASTVVTVAMQSNVLVQKSSNMLIHAVGAAEHITSAGEQRAKIYADAVVRNGALSEREAELKLLLRTRALEAQELASRVATPAKPGKNKPAAGNGAQPAVQAAPETA